MIKLDIQELLKLPNNVIYALVNTNDKKIHIGYSNTFKSALGNIIKNLDEGTFSVRSVQADRDNLELHILETHNLINNLLLRYKVSELNKEYLSQGYTLYSSYKPLQLKARVDVMHSGRMVRVSLITGRLRRLKVKEFSKMQDAKHYVANTSLGEMLEIACGV